MFGWCNDESVGGIEGALKTMLQEDPNFGESKYVVTMYHSKKLNIYTCKLSCVIPKGTFASVWQNTTQGK